ncbi:MAG: hypothetical protein LBV47_09295 [Bacteroidales bacterium]|nr:hypothetical protein [Bacteroidales bacterium]
MAALAIAAAIAFNVGLNTNSNNLSDLSLANVEALSQPEEGYCNGLGMTLYVCASHMDQFFYDMQYNCAGTYYGRIIWLWDC